MPGFALQGIEGLAKDNFANLLVLHRARRTAGGRFSG
jgi:hypothetical protein